MYKINNKMLNIFKNFKIIVYMNLIFFSSCVPRDPLINKSSLLIDKQNIVNEKPLKNNKDSLKDLPKQNLVKRESLQNLKNLENELLDLKSLKLFCPYK